LPGAHIGPRARRVPWAACPPLRLRDDVNRRATLPAGRGSLAGPGPRATGR
jgi:hypothetical protein